MFVALLFQYAGKDGKTSTGTYYTVKSAIRLLVLAWLAPAEVYAYYQDKHPCVRKVLQFPTTDGRSVQPERMVFY